MSARRLLLAIGEFLVGQACRQLPAGLRQERYREWVAELPAILADRQAGPAPLRAARMLGYAADTFRGAARAPVTGRRPQPLMTAAFWTLLMAGLGVAAAYITAIAGAPGDPLNYLRLAWALLQIAYSVAMLRHSAPRVSIALVSAGSLAGAAVSLWAAARSPADWANYFSAALLLALTLATWIVARLALRQAAVRDRPR